MSVLGCLCLVTLPFEGTQNGGTPEIFSDTLNHTCKSFKQVADLCVPPHKNDRELRNIRSIWSAVCYSIKNV